MKKLTILVTLIAVLAGSLFAADTYESGILFHTNTYVDDADGYVATERSVSLDYLSSTGEVLASTEAEAFYGAMQDPNDPDALPPVPTAGHHPLPAGPDRRRLCHDPLQRRRPFL